MHLYVCVVCCMSLVYKTVILMYVLKSSYLKFAWAYVEPTCKHMYAEKVSPLLRKKYCFFLCFLIFVDITSFVDSSLGSIIVSC